MELNYKVFGEGKPLIILHGLFGSSDNWQTHAKKLAEKYNVYTIDQRNHGKSPWSNAFNYAIMAEDLHEFVEQHEIKDFILMGHSMGGKVAIQYAQNHPETISHLIIVDMGLKEYPITHDRIIEGLKSINILQLESRRAANEQLAKYVPEDITRLFLLKNLYRKKEGGWGWHINISVLDDKLPEIVKSSPRKQTLVKALFISGGKSNYVLKSDYPSIKEVFPNAAFYVIEEADHWIHAEAPEEFLATILHFIES